MIIRTLFIANLTLILSALSGYTYAGGVGLGATRIIYQESAQQASLPVTNSDSHERYLIQAWVTEQGGNKSPDFVITPPLFASTPKSENTLRIVYLGKALPADREKVYWINVKAIPAVDPASLKGKNTLQLAILSRIKLFMRPEGLGMEELDAINHLSFQQSEGYLKISNPTPYYQTLVNMSIAGNKLPNSMVEPASSLDVPLPKGDKGVLSFQTINDYGGISEKKMVHPQ